MEWTPVLGVRAEAPPLARAAGIEQVKDADGKAAFSAALHDRAWAARASAVTFKRVRHAVLLGVAMLGTVAAHAQPIFSTEYEIKAALLFHLTQFTEWPTNAFAETDSPIVIGVLGQNPFGASLDKIVADERVQNRRVVTRSFADLEAINCHLLFVSRSEAPRVEPILARIRRRPILSVSDIDYFAHRGGMIGLTTERNRVRPVVNVGAVEAAGLKISSKLLRIAERINEK